MIYFLMAIFTAALALALGQKADKTIRHTLVFVLPLCVIFIYGFLGSPDMPSAMHALPGAAEQSRRQAAYLARKPLEDLQKNPDNIGALAVMGEISHRLGEDKAATGFYQRALIVAEKSGDPHAEIYKEKLMSLRAQLR